MVARKLHRPGSRMPAAHRTPQSLSEYVQAPRAAGFSPEPRPQPRLGSSEPWTDDERRRDTADWSRLRGETGTIVSRFAPFLLAKPPLHGRHGAGDERRRSSHAICPALRLLGGTTDVPPLSSGEIATEPAGRRRKPGPPTYRMAFHPVRHTGRIEPPRAVRRGAAVTRPAGSVGFVGRRRARLLTQLQEAPEKQPRPRPGRAAWFPRPTTSQGVRRHGRGVEGTRRRVTITVERGGREALG